MKNFFAFSIAIFSSVTFFAQVKNQITLKEAELTKLIKYTVDIEYFDGKIGYEINPREGNPNKQINASIVYEELSENWYVDKIPFQTKREFVRNLHEKVCLGKLKAYQIKEIKGAEPVFEEFSSIKAADIGKDTIVKTIGIFKEKIGYVDTTVLEIRCLDPNHIVKISFLERWTYNPKTFSIKKKIIAYAPVRIQFNYSMDKFHGLQEMYWILCD
jgi:hypothetical protein